MTQVRRQFLLLALLLTLIPGCRTLTGTAGIRTELYFGLTRPGGVAIAEPEWQTFLDDYVTPRFPDGLTVVSASGQWKNKKEEIHTEPTKILIIIHDGAQQHSAAIDEIRTEYKRRFNQESVLRVDEFVGASF